MIAPYSNGQIVVVLSLILPEDGTRGTVIDRGCLLVYSDLHVAAPGEPLDENSR